MSVLVLAPDVPDRPPRLLVALRARDEVSAAIDRALPGVPWGYLESTARVDRQAAEALLADSLTGPSSDFDPGSIPNVRFVQRIYTGLDGFPFQHFPPGVEIAGNVGAYAPYVAEQALLLALAALRALPHSLEMVRAGTLRPVTRERSLFGSTGVVLGYGAIGAEIGRRLAASGASVVGLNRSGTPASGVDRMFSADRLAEALPLGHVVFEVRPLTRRTAGSIGRNELERMRPDALLVGVGRAGTIDEEALYRHLETHPDFRAALDVWWHEDYPGGRLGARFPFASLPNFLGTPHNAGAVRGAEDRALQFALDNLARFFRDGRPEHVVDRSEYPS